MSRIIAPSRKLWTPPQRQRGYVVLDPYRSVGGSGYPLTPPWANVVALLHLDGADGSTTIVDETGRSWAAGGSAALSTSDKVFGSAALLLGAGGKIAASASTDFDFGGDDFTIDARFNATLGGSSAGTYRTIIARDDVSVSANRGWLLLLDGDFSGKLEFSCRVGTTTYTVQSSAAPSLSTWHHAAVVRDGSVLRLYLDGVQVDAVAITGALNNPAKGVRIGVAQNGSSDLGPGFVGRIDEVRVVNGFCCYPGGESFTPPSNPFPSS